MIQWSEVVVELIIAHHIGRVKENEGVYMMQSAITPEGQLTGALRPYFFSSFTEPIEYTFIQNETSAVKDIAESIFTTPENFIDDSERIAQWLYQQSVHPNIKQGDLIIALCRNIIYNGKSTNGIVLIKSEIKSPFLALEVSENDIDMELHFGIALNRIDKGCLILQDDEADDMKLLVIDRSNQAEAKYWVNDFLQAEICSNDYLNTREYIELTQTFIQDQIAEDESVDKLAEAEMLQRSQAFFTASTEFNDQEYADRVFQRKELVDDFLDYKSSYAQDQGLELSDDFEISQQALKKQNKVFRSVLKLDKNFHIYIHGNRDLIEKGVDHDGRKYYKVYYDKES